MHELITMSGRRHVRDLWGFLEVITRFSSGNRVWS